MTAIEQIEPADWRRAIERALAGGERFAGAWASERDGRLRWRALIVSPRTMRVLCCDAPERSVESIVDLVEAADWDEREAHDLYGLRFAGHEPLRALVTHTDDPALWMTPVSGDGVHQIAVGPIHAGVIESGHFRFHVIGERILAMDPRLFYKHRGLQRAAEGRQPDQALAYVQRACAACAVANTLAYAHAVEDALGLRPDRELRIARTVLLELERVYNHLHDIGAICAGVGFAAGSMAFAALKDRAQQLNAQAFGHRFLFGTIAVGAGGVELDDTGTDTLRAHLGELRDDVRTAWRELEFAGSLQARLAGVGVLARDDALRLGAVGPAARAAGVREDARSNSPALAYESFVAATPGAPAGDVATRFELRAIELEASCELLEELLAKPLARGSVVARGSHSQLAVGRVESPRGATACAVELDENQVARVHLRTGSYANWPALAHATAGNLIPDFPLINKSFELCYACVDR
ncbi:MAG: NADH-quinone oxidoreductase subunit C [Solirubrobacteraceae bacterium]